MCARRCPEPSEWRHARHKTVSFARSWSSRGSGLSAATSSSVCSPTSPVDSDGVGRSRRLKRPGSIPGSFRFLRNGGFVGAARNHHHRHRASFCGVCVAEGGRRVVRRVVVAGGVLGGGRAPRVGGGGGTRALSGG